MCEQVYLHPLACESVEIREGKGPAEPHEVDLKFEIMNLKLESRITSAHSPSRSCTRG